MSTLMSGARMLAECLAREGVDCMFGYPGGVTLPFYDALYDHQIRHILVRHEENAAFAAEGYARATGKVGVCCATSGPGATNLITGLVDSMMDSIPIVALTGQVTSKLIGSDAFQEADTFGLTRSCTKHNFMVKNVAELPQIVHEAFYIAASGRPGPVLVDIPKDVFMAQGYYTPVICTLMCLGGLPADHPNFVSMPGMHGSYAANMGMSGADVIVALGVRFEDRVTGRLAAFAPHAKIIHVDIDPAEIGKNRAPEVPIVGDVKRVLEKLNKTLGDTKPSR